MRKIERIKNLDHWEDILANSAERIACVLKYNEQAQICLKAYENFQAYISSFQDIEIDFYTVDASHDKQISKQIANDLGVSHQLPQMIIVKDLDSIWCDNYRDIELASIKEGIEFAIKEG